MSLLTERQKSLPETVNTCNSQALGLLSPPPLGPRMLCLLRQPVSSGGGDLDVSRMIVGCRRHDEEPNM